MSRNLTNRDLAGARGSWCVEISENYSFIFISVTEYSFSLMILHAGLKTKNVNGRIMIQLNPAEIDTCCVTCEKKLIDKNQMIDKYFKTERRKNTNQCYTYTFHAYK